MTQINAHLNLQFLFLVEINVGREYLNRSFYSKVRKKRMSRCVHCARRREWNNISKGDMGEERLESAKTK